MADALKTKIEFTTLKAEKVEFGRNNFIEVARERARTQDGLENQFISVNRGYYLVDKKERFERSISIPDEPEVRRLTGDKIREL